MEPVPEELVALARQLVQAGREITLRGFAESISVSNKLESGFDPVTRSDRDGEAAIRRLIERHCPDHGICGEEHGDKAGASRWSWSIDPIDGTRAFICGIPVWTTLIALLDEGRPVLGLVDAPRLDETYVGFGELAERVRDGKARPIETSGCADLAEARLSTTDPHLFSSSEAESFDRLRRAARLTRFGLDGYGYALVAAGRLDLLVESGLKPHDYLPLIPLVRAAGGTIGDWEGGEDFSGGRLVAAASRALFDQAIATLRSAE